MNKNIFVIIIILFIFLITYLINCSNNELFNNKIIKKNMIFTSAGDNTNFYNNWVGNNQNYDIYAIYYGNNNNNFNLYKKKVNFIEKRKGSKFQNFYYFYNKYPEIINKYDRFFILDDDIIFNSYNDINKMFSISKKYNLSICGPTFKNNGKSKISHKITIQQPKNLLRYVNFIEVNVPLFNKKSLDKLMIYYNPILIGWGIDYLYIWANGLENKKKYALIDSINCINPYDNNKNNKRELNNIKNAHNRKQIWDNYKKKYNIIEWKHKTYSNILKN
jgi:hypothetical protein